VSFIFRCARFLLTLVAHTFF